MANASTNRTLVVFDPNVRGKKLFSLGFGIMIFIMLVILGTSISLEVVFGGNGLWFVSGMTLILCWLGLSIRQIQIDELAGIEFFGAPVREVSHGAHFVPFLLFRLRQLPAFVLQHEFPKEPEQVFKGLDVEFDHDSDLVRPIRITTGSRPRINLATGEPYAGPLEVQMTAEVLIFVRWRIREGYYFQFRRNIQTLTNAVQQLRDTAEGALIEISGQDTMGYMVRETKNINMELEERLRDLVEDWGVEILSVGIKEPDLTREVNLKLAAIAEAKAAGDAAIQTAEKEAVATIKTAEAEKQRQILEGAGAAQAEKLRLVARGQGIKRFAKDADVCGGEVLGAEVADNMFGETDKVVLGGTDGLRDVFAAAKVATEAFKGNASEDKADEEETA